MTSPHGDKEADEAVPPPLEGYGAPTSTQPKLRVVNIPLRRNNSTLRFYPSIITNSDLPRYQSTMATCQLYRQYTFGGGNYLEPRVHVMLSSSSRRRPTLGYSYHGVKMRPLPIDLVPEFEGLAKDYAERFELPQNKWSIGVDLIVYRDGKDSIGWHADDTQAENCVLAVVIESDGIRPVCIRPNKKVKDLEEGDEEVELYPGQGDGYELDAGCQQGYEHALPKRKEVKARRMVAIFRQGESMRIAKLRLMKHDMSNSSLHFL